MHAHMHTLTHYFTQVGAKEFSTYLVIQALPSFSGTGQTEEGWSASAAGKPRHNEMVVSFLFPMGQEEEAIHGGELGQCCGLAHDKQERASFTFRIN